ncbi:reverse transcriptase domain-containing protein [Tanacetum coccineum]
MHTHASNSELVEPLSEPKRTLNRRPRRRNKIVPFERRDEQPAQPRIVYLPIFDINYFRHFLDILENYNLMDDEPMWSADHVVNPTPVSAITIPKTSNEFAIKAGGIFLYKTPNQAYQLLEDKVLLKLVWAKNQKTKSYLKKIVAFADEGSSNSDTDKIMARMDAMTMKMDAQYKEMQSRSNHSMPEYDEDDKFIEDEEEESTPQPKSQTPKPVKEAPIPKPYKPNILYPQCLRKEKMESQYDFDAILDEGSEILHSIEGTILKEKLFAEFDELMSMNIKGNTDSESETEEPPFKKITFNTDYKIKTSLEVPHSDLELKPLPNHLEYVFLEEPSFLLLLEDKKPVVQKQRRLNPNMQEVVKKDIIKLLDTGIIYPIADSPWDANVVLNWEKCHFIVKEGIVLGHKVSGAGLEVDKAKINVISKLLPPTNVKGIRSLHGHAGFYRRFIKDFSKIARPLTKLLKKDIPFEFNDECYKAFNSLKEKLTCTLMIVSPNWNLPFEFMCDASKFAVRAILGQKDGTENVVANHLSRIDNDETSDDSDVDDNFPGETLMEITTKDIPWFAGDIIRKGMRYQQKNKFFSDLKNYFWEDPYLFKVCSDNMIRHCVLGPETRTILDQCHHGPTGGHYGPNTTAKQVLDSGFYWQKIIKEAHTLASLCEACQKTGNISKHDEIPLNSIQVCKVFDIWGIDFMGSFP